MQLKLSSIQADSIGSILSLATRDAAFAAELKNAAQAAQQAGVGSKEWDTLMQKFFSDPNDLALIRLVQTGDGRIQPQFTITTITTLTTFTTAF
ncbi:hypothetical protein QCL51_17790 [Pseudomonas sp. LTR0]|uniref:hypothetical protein n=1 Tax=Pseudomonas sp. LTR0 TaxID=3040601 RepID=UPI0030CC5306